MKNELAIGKVEKIKQLINDDSSDIMVELQKFLIKRLKENGHDEDSLLIKERMIELAFKEKRIDEIAKINLFNLLMKVQQCFLNKDMTLNLINTPFKEEDTMNGKIKNHDLITYLKEFEYPLKEEDRVKLLKYYYLEMNKAYFKEEELEDVKSSIQDGKTIIIGDDKNEKGRLFS